MKHMWISIKIWFMLYVRDPIVDRIGMMWAWINKPCCDNPKVEVDQSFGHCISVCKNCKSTWTLPPML